MKRHYFGPTLGRSADTRCQEARAKALLRYAQEFSNGQRAILFTRSRCWVQYDTLDTMMTGGFCLAGLNRARCGLFFKFLLGFTLDNAFNDNWQIFQMATTLSIRVDFNTWWCKKKKRRPILERLITSFIPGINFSISA